MLYTGGCFCGSVRYQIAGTLDHACLCHCASCRRASGSVAVPWATFARGDFTWTARRPADFQSSPGVVRTFCPSCGTPLTYWSEQCADVIDVAVGTLDAPNAAAPTDHLWMSDALSWDRPADGLTQYSKGRL